MLTTATLPVSVADNTQTVTHINASVNKVLLKVVPIRIHSSNGVFSTNALLDDGSTVSLISAGLAKRAGLRGRSETMCIRGAWSDDELVCETTITNVTLCGMDSKMHSIKVRCVDNLNLPLQQLSVVDCNNYKNLFGINDKLCRYDVKPEILIGQDNSHLLLPLKVIVGKPYEPSATLTPLGWCVHGMLRRPHTQFAASTGEAHATLLLSSVATTAADKNEYLLRELHEEVRHSFAVDALGVSDEMWSSVESGGSNGHAVPCARGKHSATLLGGHVYVLGGRGAGGAVPLRDFWRYSLATGKWEKLECRGEPPPSLQEHSATAHEAKLYVFGGEAGALSNETPLWIYDTETHLWRKLPGQSGYTSTVRRRGSRDTRGAALGPRGRRGHSAHALKDCLLIYGGYKDLRGSTHELWAFHYESESWQQVRCARAGPARHRHAAALHDNRLYVHGGQCDLRDCADLWYYDTMSRVWSAVRCPARLCPGARSGHACVRAGAHLYVFGGEARGHATNELWRFHFATETWERIMQGLKWPSPRVDSCALLVPAEPPRAAPRPPAPRHPAPPASLLQEISKLSSFHLRKAARCSYSALAGERDSTESLVRQEAAALCKSHSAYIIDKRQPADGGESPREGDVVESRSEMSREPISVPDFADMILPTPVLSPVEATKLVYLDSEDEEEMRREINNIKRDNRSSVKLDGKVTIVTVPKSASVRFIKDTTVADEEEAELSTSDYASAERVNRLSGTSLGFSNPHYLGPDVRTLGVALTPDSGVSGGDIELHELRGGRRAGGAGLHLLLVGGREPPHPALLQSPLSMWTYRLL